jgi:hypothetical protein
VNTLFLLHRLDQTYHLISHDKKVIFFSQNSDVFQFISCENFANRVVWRVDNDHLGTRSDGSACGCGLPNMRFTQPDTTHRSSSKSMVQSWLVGFVWVPLGGWSGTYTGLPPLNVTDGRYWSKNGSNMMTSSPSSKNAVNTEYCPESGVLNAACALTMG